jgi:hypothetical protein
VASAAVAAAAAPTKVRVEAQEASAAVAGAAVKAFQADKAVLAAGLVVSPTTQTAAARLAAVVLGWVAEFSWTAE